MTTKPPQRVICYVDGFNLYFGLKAANYKRFLWLNVHALAGKILLPHQELLATKYFTARIRGGQPTDSQAYRADQEAKRRRQAVYLDALATVPEIQIFEGHYLVNPVKCRRCGSQWSAGEEKMTDVNIATEILIDTYANRFDTAVLISGDSDLVPPVRAVLSMFGHKRVIIAFPPQRHSKQLADAASGQFIISKGSIRKSQLDDEIETATGHVLRRPSEWERSVST